MPTFPNTRKKVSRYLRIALLFFVFLISQQIDLAGGDELSSETHTFYTLGCVFSVLLLIATLPSNLFCIESHYLDSRMGTLAPDRGGEWDLLGDCRVFYFPIMLLVILFSFFGATRRSYLHTLPT